MGQNGHTMVLVVAIGAVLSLVASSIPMTDITIGVIVDSSRTVSGQERETDADVTCNVTIVWHYANYSEIFYLFKAVRHLDADPDVDVIVLTDYTPSLWASSHLLETKHKSLVKLVTSTTGETPALLRQLAQQYLNESTVPAINYVSKQVCKETFNVSLITSSSVLLGDTLSSAPAQILARLVRLQKWRTLHVFYDTATEQDVRVFVDTLSGYSIAFSLYNVDDISSMHDILVRIYDLQATLNPEIHFAVICRLECLCKVLHAANRFDGVPKTKQSLLSLFSRWLVVVHNYTPVAGRLIQTVAGELSNVAVVVVPGVNGIPVQSIKLWIREIISDTVASVTEDADLNEVMIEGIKTGLFAWDPTSACSGYVIMTSLWTKTGRELSDIGHASLSTSLHLHSEVFPNIKYGYSDKHFTIVTLAYPPYVVEKETKNGTKEFAGVCIDLLKELSRVLNFTYTLIEQPDKKWGSVDRVENGTYILNGMIGTLQRHEADFAAAPLVIIPVRDAVSDFAYPIYYDYSTVIYKRPDPNLNKWRTLIDPLKVNVLMSIGMALVLVTVAVFLLEKYNAYYSHPSHAASREEQGGLHRLHDSFWYIYGALLCQGGVNLPDSIAGRTLVSGWWIFCIIIVGTYCGNLIAFLTVSKDVPPFNTLQQLADMKGDYTWGTQGGTNWEHAFTTSKLSDFRKVGDAMIEFNKTDPGTFHTDIDVHIGRVSQGGYAYIGDVTTFEFVRSTACELRMIKEEFLPMKVSFAFQQNSPHTAIFSEQIMKAEEAGLIAIWKRKWWPENVCFTKTMPEAKPISLNDVQGAHYLCAIGFVVGMVAFVVEVVIFRCLRSRKAREETSKQISIVAQTNREQTEHD